MVEFVAFGSTSQSFEPSRFHGWGIVVAVPAGPLWQRMNGQQRHDGVISKVDIPSAPGVYAWYQNEAPIYVGKADSLQNRLWKNHLGKGRVMTGSAFRRNVAEHLGISTAALIKSRSYQPSDDEVAQVRAFIEGRAVAWVTTDTPGAAVSLETRMKAEWMPPLTKR